LLIRSGGIGDSILTLPVAVRLRELYPGAELHLLGNGNMISAARLTGLFTCFRSLDDAGFSALYAKKGTSPFLQAYFSQFDRVYCFTAGNREDIARTILANGARACRTLDPRQPRNWERHITDYFFSILDTNCAGPAVLPEPIIIHSSPRRNDLLVIHPGSGGVSKMWPVKRFVDVAETWNGETAFLLGPAEIQKGYAGRIPGRFRLIENPPLSDAALLLSIAGLYLGNDSGASHLAALCGTPSVVLFGATSPRVWGPLGGKARIIVSPGGNMEELCIEEVLMALRNLSIRPSCST